MLTCPAGTWHAAVLGAPTTMPRLQSAGGCGRAGLRLGQRQRQLAVMRGRPPQAEVRQRLQTPAWAPLRACAAASSPSCRFSVGQRRCPRPPSSSGLPEVLPDSRESRPQGPGPRCISIFFGRWGTRTGHVRNGTTHSSKPSLTCRLGMGSSNGLPVCCTTAACAPQCGPFVRRWRRRHHKPAASRQHLRMPRCAG